MADDAIIARAFGHDWHSDIALPLFAPRPPGAKALPAIIVRRSEGPSARAVLRPVPRGIIHADGVRLDWEDQAGFDIYDNGRIDFWPMRGWRGALPDVFFSTVAALALAGRGYVPFHASAIALDGHAVLVAGRSGAGKSTLAAGLCEGGARLLGDDLSVVAIGSGGGAMVLPGRPTIRLHPETAARIGAVPMMPPRPDPRGKLLAYPAAGHAATGLPDQGLPLAGVIVLGDAPLRIDPPAAARLLLRQLFRPRWQAALHGYRARVPAMLSLAGQIRIVGFPAMTGTSALEQGDRVERARLLIDEMIAGASI